MEFSEVVNMQKFVDTLEQAEIDLFCLVSRFSGKKQEYVKQKLFVKVAKRANFISIKKQTNHHNVFILKKSLSQAT